MIILAVFIFGAIIGSFLNVCIYRLPEGKSIVWPNSFCPKCGKSIRFYDNIPIISFLILGGRCRDCGSSISKRYILVESITAIVGVLLFLKYSICYDFFIYCLLSYSLIVISFIDLEHQLVPDVISLPGILLGLVLMSFFSGNTPGFIPDAFLDSLFGILAGGLSIFFMGLLGSILFKKEAMGGGDVKLMAMIGAFIGWKLVLLAFFMAPFLGSIVGVYILVKKKETVIPYAPYLSLASFISLFYGSAILKLLFPEY